MQRKDPYEKNKDIDAGGISDNGNVAKSRKSLYIKWLAAAACLTLVILAFFV